VRNASLPTRAWENCLDNLFDFSHTEHVARNCTKEFPPTAIHQKHNSSFEPVIQPRSFLLMKDARRSFFRTGISTVLFALIAPAALDSLLPALASALVLFFLLSLAEGEELSPKALFHRCARVPPDESAWRDFFQRYDKVIEQGICKVIGVAGWQRDRLGRDVRQNFHMRLLNNGRRALLAFRGETEFEARAYLQRIAVSVALTAAVKDKRTRPDELLEDEEQPKLIVRGPSEEIATRIDLENCLQKTLRGRNKTRNAIMFKLFAIDNLKPAEIAQIAGLNMTLRAIEIQISRIREKLRKCFDRK